MSDQVRFVGAPQLQVPTAGVLEREPVNRQHGVRHRWAFCPDVRRLVLQILRAKRSLLCLLSQIYKEMSSLRLSCPEPVLANDCVYMLRTIERTIETVSHTFRWTALGIANSTG